MSDFDIKTADRQELAKYALEEFGLELDLRQKTATLRAKVAEQMGINPASLPKENEVEKLKSSIVQSDKKTDKKYLIIMSRPQGATNDFHVVSVNGKRTQIRFNEEVLVDESIIEVLEHAKETEYWMEKDAFGQRVQKSREFLRFPFQVIRGPRPANLEAA